MTAILQTIVFLSLSLCVLAQNSINSTISPYVMIISMFGPEQDVWLSPYNLTTNYTIRGGSVLYPEAHCNANGTICQFTTGEGTANAASSITALTLSSLFDLSKTYFMISGIAGVNPEVASIGSATFPRYAVDIDLVYAVSAFDAPKNFSQAFWNFGTDSPGIFPTELYGYEIFEINSTLRSAAVNLAYQQSNFSSIDTANLTAFRNLYNQTRARDPPSIFECGKY